MLEFMFSHSFWGLCAWDLPALIVLAAMILFFIVHCHRMERREEELEDELAEQKTRSKSQGRIV